MANANVELKWYEVGGINWLQNQPKYWNWRFADLSHESPFDAKNFADDVWRFDVNFLR